MAARQPPGAHPDPPEQTVLLYGLERIERATGRKPARRREHGGDEAPIRLYQGYAGLLQNHGLLGPAPSRIHRAAQLPQRLAELPAQLLKRSVAGRRARGDHQVQALGHVGRSGVEDLLQSPSHGVARHRVAHLSGDGEPQASSVAPVLEGVHGDQLAPKSGAPTVDPLELRRVGQSGTLRPRQRSDSQPLAAPPATGGDHPPSANRAHTLAETVRLRSLTTIRLIGTLHKTPLRTLRDLKTIHGVYPNPTASTSTRNNTSPHPNTTDPRRHATGNSCKTSFILPISSAMWLAMVRVPVRITRVWAPAAGGSTIVIHSMWIRLWINTLIRCKTCICWHLL